MGKWLRVAFAAWGLTLLHAQGFSKGPARLKKNITLERKLPAAVQLVGTSIGVKVAAQNPQYKDVAQRLESTIETEIVRYSPQLAISDTPDTLITANVLSFTIPPPVPVADPYGASLTAAANSNKKNGQQAQQPTAFAITGTLSINYQARARGRGIDALPITVKFYEEVNSATRTKTMLNKLSHPGKSSAANEDNPQTVSDLEQILVSRASARVAARLVNTNEKVEVHLARGALDENNRYADAGQWTHFVEGLETMPPLPKPEDDAYRMYNIGVGDEALGYKAETPAEARHYFEKAVIQYRGAGEANPHEKYFIEPVNRIEVALEHYKKLAAPAPPPAATTKKGAKKP